MLAFLLGMPLFAVPQVSEQLQGLLRADPREQRAEAQNLALASEQSDPEDDPAQYGTTLAADQPPASQVTPNPDGRAAVIEALKAEFVAAGVTYMVLERVAGDSPHYRFRFDLPVATGSAYRKRFQVVDDAPDEAMRKAFRELHEWRVAMDDPAHLERPTVMLR